MPCKELISYEIQPLQLNHTVTEAIHTLEVLQLEQLPVVNEVGTYLGIVSFDILSHAQGSHSLQQLVTHTPLIKVAVNSNAFPYRAAKIMYENDLDIVPVVNDEDILQGAIDYKLVVL
jgi:CBS domain-containing protein